MVDIDNLTAGIDRKRRLLMKKHCKRPLVSLGITAIGLVIGFGLTLMGCDKDGEDDWSGFTWTAASYSPVDSNGIPYDGTHYENIYGIAYGGGKFVAVGSSGRMWNMITCALS
jgi:hypothetical protein